MSERNAPTLDYSTPRKIVKPVDLRAAKTTLVTSIWSVGVGIAITALYSLTGWEIFPILGGAWLLVGAVMTTILFCRAGFMVMTISNEAENAQRGSVLYQWVLLVTLLSYPAAFVCLGVGSQLLRTPKFTLRVHNTTAVKLDRVTAHFEGRDVSVGPIEPGQFHTSGRHWLRHNGELSISVRVGREVLKKMDRLYYGPDAQESPGHVDLFIEEAEIPRSARLLSRSVP